MAALQQMIQTKHCSANTFVLQYAVPTAFEHAFSHHTRWWRLVLQQKLLCGEEQVLPLWLSRGWESAQPDFDPAAQHPSQATSSS
jgi:hypothetical protein